MARDRKRSKQRQQRRARAHRTDGRSTAQRAFGRTPEEDAPATLNGESAARIDPEPEAVEAEPAAVADQAEAEPAAVADHAEAEPADDRIFDLEEPDPVADPTSDPAFASATEPDFDEPVRPRFEESDYHEEDDESSDGGVAAAVRARPVPARPVKGNRVTGFLRASWAELQRVQWPNRQQVFQATAVVLGFVVVAGAFLAFADFLAGKIVDAIL
jgi:preprotein translocase subunit SecE